MAGTRFRDEEVMALAIRLARRADGRTNPNPRVGAVVVRGGRIVGKGYHHRAGSPHAEVLALREAGRQARGSTLYVTLEPCVHQGRTGPCTEEILNAGVKRVVVGMRDPNPRVSGKGVARLRRKGVAVAVGVRSEACRRLNEDYVKLVTSGLPFIVWKAAASIDGKLATRSGESRWITGEPSRSLVHRLRATSNAVVVGAGTVLADDPLLTSRIGRGPTRNPLRVVVDSRLRIPVKARVCQVDSSTRTLVATTKAAPARKIRELERRGVEVLVLPVRQGRVNLFDLLQVLGKRGIMNVLVEGGPELAASFLRERLIDKVCIFLAPKLIGGEEAPGPLGGPGILRIGQAVPVREMSVRRIGEDLLIEGYPVYS